MYLFILFFSFQVTAQADRPGYDPISSTLWRQREEYCARMIQTVWRRNYRTEDNTMGAFRDGILTLPDPMALLNRGNGTNGGTYHGGENGDHPL